MNDLIKHKLELLPDNPGCYLHKDKFGNIIYVGKAKNLKNRVRSYFRGSHDTKTELLVSEIADFEFIVTESNIEALLLEINLIQENMPKFNIRLKDDKSYPFIKITKELYPRLLITRQVKKDGGLYFGPYPDAGAANEIKKLLDRIFPFKKCKNPANKVCFYYHIGQCNAHTICHTTRDYWQGLVEDVKNFLNGHDNKIVNQLKVKMKDMSDQMEFERAAEYRDLIVQYRRLGPSKGLFVRICRIVISSVTTWTRGGCVFRFSLSVRENSFSVMSICSPIIMKPKRIF